MPKIMFSLPIHEQPEVVYEQIVNLNHYNPGCAVVIHINPVFKYSQQTKDFDSLIKGLHKFPNVFVNPERLEVGFNNIIQAHISNYYAVEGVDYDYFYFIASNELFLKPGVYDFISQYKYGCQDKLHEDWAHIDTLKADPDLAKIIQKTGASHYSYSQIEGSFYTKQIMGKICEIIKGNYDYHNPIGVYPREEVYFPTIANALFKSELHFDDCCCKIRWEAGVLFTSVQAVNKIAKSGNEEFHYSVKRVDRDLDDYLRYYIRMYIGKYLKEERKYVRVPMRKYSLAEIYAKNTYYLVLYFFRRKVALAYHKVTGTHAG